MLGLLSDAHGNLAGFAKGLEVLERHGAHRFLFLGDAVGYIPSWAVVDELYKRRDQFEFVLGNHEEMVLAGSGRRDDVYQHEALRKTMGPPREAFIGSWKRSLSLDLACGSVLLVHGSPDDTQNGYLHPDTPLDGIDVDQAYVFCGHTHRPFIRSAGDSIFVNIGSCGLPRDDGRYGSAALLNEENGEIQIVRYEIEKETELFLRDFETLHPSVAQVLARRSNELIGEIYV
jgi:predicted phosphodiesterase